MDRNYQRPNGSAAATNGHSAGTSRPGSVRLPTVDEALPYTPFSSIIPFSPEIISPPLAQPTAIPSFFSSSEDVVRVQRVLTELSEGATNAENASRRCQQTLHDVQKLLDPDSLMQFKFRKTKRASAIGRRDARPSETPSLSPFAKMVFEDAKYSHRYLTAESPEPQIKAEPSRYTSAPQALPHPQSHASQKGILKNSPVGPQPSGPPDRSGGSRFEAAAVSDTLGGIQRTGYQPVTTDSGKSVVAQRAAPSKRPEVSVSNGYRSVSVDLKQKADFLVQNLRDLLLEIFEAEDHLEPDTSGAVAMHANTIFATRSTDDGSVLVLQPDMQARLESHVQKVVANGLLESIDIDTWTRTQRICESAVAAVEAANLQISEDWSDDDAQEWAMRVAYAERGLVASHTLLCIMGAGSHIKELQSEEVLRSILASFSTVVETCIVPIVEERASAGEKIKGAREDLHSNSKFAAALVHRKPLQTLLQATTKTLRSLGDFLTKAEMDESTVSTMEYLCKLLIFAENASNDRDSILGLQNFENTRRCAMDVLARIFAQYTEQRQYIFQEILTSLEKLPATKQSARHFRLLDAKPIQLVSALLMRLVQTSATYGSESMHTQFKATSRGEQEDNADDESSVHGNEDNYEAKVFSGQLAKQSEDLISLAKPIHDAAQSNASYIVKFLIHRALSASKSSDEPYRRLLDIFVDDFLNVVGSSDWPSAELLLRTLVLHMISLIDNPKSTAPSRTLALELLGNIGSGILGLQITARNAIRSLDSSGTGISERLVSLVQQLETGDIELTSLVAFDGPFRVVTEFLRARGLDDAQLRSAHGYHLMQWAFHVCSGREWLNDPEIDGTPHSTKDLQHKLRNMLVDDHWLEDHDEFPTVSTSEGRLAAMVISLSSKLCKAFNKIFNILLTSLSSEHPTVRARSIKSVVSLLERDPSILDRNAHVINHIFRCGNDPSPLVRDSALKLIEDCLKQRPALEKGAYERVIDRTRDAALGVRKRAMRMLKEIYLRNDSVKLRSDIADALVARMEDAEESIAEIARQTMEEIWFLPFHNHEHDGGRSVKAKLQYASQAGLLVRTIETSANVGAALEGLIKELVTQSKLAGAHSAVCTTLVRVLFDGIISSDDIPGAPSQASILRCLAVFAKASPKLFNASQVERLEPYTQNLTKSDDLEVYRAAITILRHVMPHQSTLKHDFLQKLQTSLLTSVARLQKSELVEVVPCLWTINGMLGNIERLVNFVASALKGIYGMRAANFAAEPQLVLKATKLMTIVGQFGVTCDFDDHLASFKAVLPSYRGTSVAGLMVEVLSPFSSPKQPLAIRELSLEAISTISQAWPKLFLRPDVVNAFELVLNDREPCLEHVLLQGLESFFSAQEASRGGENVPQLGSGIASGNERLGKTYLATDQDGASTSIAQRFMGQILRIALSSSDERAAVAAKLIVSINRQGLVHPKECGPALVALETCPDAAIANMAFVQHKVQHSKHESLFDKEYMRAVQQAFEYQKNTLGSTVGFTGHPPVSKMTLLWEVLKTGKAQVRKKFLTNISQKLDFDLQSLDATSAAPRHLLFVRFCVENLAFFEYDKVEEVLHLLKAMEKTFAGTGTIVAQAIESEMLKLRVDLPFGLDATANDTLDPFAAVAAATTTAVDPHRVLQLAIAAQICSLIWETISIIRRLWNMHRYTDKPKNAAKDSNKAPSRAPNASPLSDSYIKRVAEIMSANATEDSQRAICSSFVELISIDHEVKVGSDEGDTVDHEFDEETPSEGTGRKSPLLTPSGGRSRKRKSVSASSTPRKKARFSNGSRKGSSAKPIGEDKDDEEDD